MHDSNVSEFLSKNGCYAFVVYWVRIPQSFPLRTRGTPFTLPLAFATWHHFFFTPWPHQFYYPSDAFVDISCAQHPGTNSKLRILVKAKTSTSITWPLSPTRLGIRPQDLALPNEYTLGHCGLLDTNVLSQAGITHYSQLATWHDSTLLNSFVNIYILISAYLQSSNHHMRGSAKLHLK